MQLMGAAAMPGTRDASHVMEAAMVTPTGGTRPVPMTLEQARTRVNRIAARRARARDRRKALDAEARALVAKAAK
jgi:hypothetical protein